MPASNYEDEINAAIQAATANQGAYNRYAPYAGTDPSEQQLLQRVPGASVPLDVAAIAQGILRAQGRNK
jgi:hypothetical protein